MLNDPKLPDLLETYGEGLSREADFREYLKNLSSGKLLPLLKAVLSDEGYKEKMAQEKYEFLRTKEIFKICMDQAYEQFGWTKKSF